MDTRLSVAGLDLSQRAAGVAVIDSQGGIHTYTFGSNLTKQATERQKTWRNIEITNSILRVLKTHAVKVCGVEDYAFSQKSSSVHGLAELGGLVKAQVLLGMNIDLLPIPSSAIRKFLFQKNIKDKKLIRKKLLFMGFGQPQNTDESDALAVALVIDAYSNRRATVFEKHELDLFDRLDARTA